MLVDFILSALSAGFYTFLFALIIKRTGPFGLFQYSAAVFLVSWAAGLWIAPSVNILLGNYRYSFAAAGGLFSIFTASLPRRSRVPVRRPDDTNGGFDKVFLPITVIAALLAVAGGYAVIERTTTLRTSVNSEAGGAVSLTIRAAGEQRSCHDRSVTD